MQLDQAVKVYQECHGKVIVSHSYLSTTQRYLGKISDADATKWIENLYG